MNGEISAPEASIPISCHHRVKRVVPHPYSSKVSTLSSFLIRFARVFFCQISALLYRVSYYCSYLSVYSRLKNHSVRSCHWVSCLVTRLNCFFCRSLIIFSIYNSLYRREWPSG